MAPHTHDGFSRHSGATTRLSVKDRGSFTDTSLLADPVQVTVTVTVLWLRIVGAITLDTVTFP
jgi:hypothetical protein